jgi:hypothetical protein
LDDLVKAAYGIPLRIISKPDRGRFAHRAWTHDPLAGLRPL